MIKRYTAALVGAALSAMCMAPAFAQGTMSSPMPMSSGGSMSSPAPMSSGGSMGGSMSHGSMGGSMKGGSMGSMGGARFGGSVYTGRPALQNTLSLVVAGGGPSNFHTTTLVKSLAGPAAGPEVAKLTKMYGAAGVKQYLSVFDFVIADSLKIVTAAHVALPKSPAPSPKNGKALTTALYMDGVDKSTGAFNVEYMLDHLVTHPVHVQVMKDIDAKYGAKADATYHVVTLQVFKDLKAAYGL